MKTPPRYEAAHAALWELLRHEQLGVRFARKRFGPYGGIFYSAAARLALYVTDEEPPPEALDLFRSEDIRTVVGRANPAARVLGCTAGEVLDTPEEVLRRLIDALPAPGANRPVLS